MTNYDSNFDFFLKKQDLTTHAKTVCMKCQFLFSSKKKKKKKKKKKLKGDNLHEMSEKEKYFKKSSAEIFT